MSLYGVLLLPWFVLASLLMLFHLLYDFHWQGNYIAAGKKSSKLLLTVHAYTWALFVSIPLYLVGYLTVEMFVFLLVTHWVMDWVKGHKLRECQGALVFDQLVHVLTLAVCLWRW